ncbi:hypothetical protein HD806DRAFT_485119 [Xylariaceae sp. AK1471]|nr:hypothetical protein HD806DRAFT_485119 [Xylariaceae sp. AK1471]
MVKGKQEGIDLENNLECLSEPATEEPAVKSRIYRSPISRGYRVEAFSRKLDRKHSRRYNEVRAYTHSSNLSIEARQVNALATMKRTQSQARKRSPRESIPSHHAHHASARCRYILTYSCTRS